MATVAPTSADQVVARLLVGVDGSAAGRAAAVQAGRLVAPDGLLELATAVYLVEAGLQRWTQERIDAVLEREGGTVLSDAGLLVRRHATTRLLNGPPLHALLAEASRAQATLIAVGSHGHSRLSEVLIGGVCGPLLHEAACSVLIARPSTSGALFPCSVVVGVDGSPASLDALSAGEYLSDRFQVPLRVVLAEHGHVDLPQAQIRAPLLDVVDDRPVEALTKASESADLLVVGSRGLRGFASMGSVSERVAHRAHGSVLIVRARDVRGSLR